MSQSSKSSKRNDSRVRVVVFQRHDELADFVELLDDLADEVEVRNDDLPRGDTLDGVALVVLPGTRLAESNAPNLAFWPPTVAVVDEASKTLLRHLNRVGVKLLLKRPIHPRTLRLLLLHQIYRGPERRGRKRVPIGHPIRVGNGLFKSSATLLDLSIAGARVELANPPAVGSPLGLVLGRELTLARPLKLKAKVVRVIRPPDARGKATGEIGVQILDARSHARTLQTILDRFALGPASWEGRIDPNEQSGSTTMSRARSATSPSPARPAPPPAPTAPVEATPARAASPQADETPDPAPAPPAARKLPPVRRPASAAPSQRARSENAPASHPPASSPARPTATRSAAAPTVAKPPTPTPGAPAPRATETKQDTPQPERRGSPRVAYDRRIVALDAEAARIFVGRELSARGMRIEPHGAVATGDVFRLALHGGNDSEPVVVTATVLRDEGEAGLVLGFEPLVATESARLERILHGIARGGPEATSDGLPLSHGGQPIVVGEMVEMLARAKHVVPHGGPEDDADVEAYLDSILEPEGGSEAAPS
ncbi:MAG: PilZ domain-containing protein [Myxococcota bacterium]